MRAFGIVVDDFASRHVSSNGDPGGQCLIVSGTKLVMDLMAGNVIFAVKSLPKRI